MKHLLISAATEAEITPFIHFLAHNYRLTSPGVYQNKDWCIRIAISGVGMMAAAFSLGTQLAAQKYDAAFQAGIAGSFDASIALGTLVAVASEQYGDLGAEDKGDYIDIFELGFLDKNTYPFHEGKLKNDHPLFIGETLPLVSALSVNTVSGQKDTIERRSALHGAQIESMEGLAFHYACLQTQTPFLQIRAISNYVTPRDRSGWQIKPAIDHLNNYLQKTFAV